MKKFKFNLESVLRYRENTEENEKNVLANLNHRLAALVQQLSALRGEYSDRAREFEAQSKEGITVHDIRSNHAFLKNIEYGIEIKLQEIDEQNKLVTRQTAVVVRAMQDTKTLDKLKENKFKIYTKEEQKIHERLIEEMASQKNAAAR
jgi:flagellar FliJ protein